MLIRVAVSFAAFDLLAINGTSTLEQPSPEPRVILEAIEFAGPSWATAQAFDDGDALWQVVVDQQLECVVAKPRAGRYVPGERRRWVNGVAAAGARARGVREGAADRRRVRLGRRPRNRGVLRIRPSD